MNTRETTTNEICFEKVTGWQQKLLKYGLLLYVIAANCSIAASQTGLSLALIGMLAMMYKGELKFRPSMIDAPYAFFMFAAIMSIFHAELLSYSITELRNFLLIAAFYLAFFPNFSEATHRRLLRIFLIWGATVAGVSIIKFFWFDIPAGLPRAQGFFSMPLTFAETMSMTAIVALSWLRSKSCGTKERNLIIFALILIGCAISLAAVRGAWLGFFAALFVMVMQTPKKMIIPAILMVTLIISVQFAYSGGQRGLSSFSISKNYEALQRDVDLESESYGIISNALRIRIWQMGYEILADFPFWGVGYRNLSYWRRQYANEFEVKNNIHFGHQHNIFHQQLLNMGYLGLIAFTWLMYNFIVASYRAYKGSKVSSWAQQMISAALPVVVFFIVAGLTEDVWGDDEVSMMFLFLTGLLISKSTYIDDEKARDAFN